MDCHFYRRKYDARKILEAFNARLRDETTLNVLSDDLAGWPQASCSPSTPLHDCVPKQPRIAGSQTSSALFTGVRAI
jgi:hypothetical protein